MPHSTTCCRNAAGRDAHLTELLLPADGVGELALLMPTLARLGRDGGTLALIAPPYLPYAPAWQAAGIDLGVLHVIEASPRDALWAFEQCLRSGACAAVVGWPRQADAQALRRLQVAADSGDCLGFVLRDRKHAANPSPAALRLEHDWRWLARAQMPRRPGTHARVRAGHALSRAHVVGLHRAAAAGAGRRPPAFA